MIRATLNNEGGYRRHPRRRRLAAHRRPGHGGRATGIYRIVDRLELIKYRGYQVPPAVLGAVLLQHPDIADAAAIGALDDDGQEFPKAFVVRRPGSELTGEQVMDFVAERVAPTKRCAR